MKGPEIATGSLGVVGPVPADTGLVRDGRVCEVCSGCVADLDVSGGGEWWHLTDLGEPALADDGHDVVIER